MVVIEAALEFLGTTQGGRRSYVATGYRADLDFDGVRVGGGFEFHGLDRVEPGESCAARVLIPDPARLLGDVDRGRRFEVFEGGTMVARGEVVNAGRGTHSEMHPSSEDGVLRLAEVARVMADGTMDLVAGCREIVRHSHRLPRSTDLDEYINVVVAVESETDHFPIGDVRQYWADDALAKADREKDAYLARARPDLLEACRRLVSALERPNR